MTIAASGAASTALRRSEMGAMGDTAYLPPDDVPLDGYSTSVCGSGGITGSHGATSYAAAAISPSACAIVRSIAPGSADTGTLLA